MTIRSSAALGRYTEQCQLGDSAKNPQENKSQTLRERRIDGSATSAHVMEIRALCEEARGLRASWIGVWEWDPTRLTFRHP